MAKLLLTGTAILAITGACALLHCQNRVQDEKFCALMENHSTFDGETVDALWHWRREGRPSKRFQVLYAEKIANLPGWRP